MITLYAFGPAFGLPEASPYVTKTEIQLKMAGLPYRKDLAGFAAAPKGKLPYIEDAGEIVADSTFIRAHLEWKYRVDLDAGLEDRQRAEAWAIERLIEDHLGWASLHARWGLRENFDKGPAHFFDAAPEAIRDKLREDVRSEVAAAMHAQGIGRHQRRNRRTGRKIAGGLVDAAGRSALYDGGNRLRVGCRRSGHAGRAVDTLFRITAAPPGGELRQSQRLCPADDAAILSGT